MFLKRLPKLICLNLLKMRSEVWRILENFRFEIDGRKEIDKEPNKLLSNFMEQSVHCVL